MDEAALRRALRKVFDKFDADKSGAVSTEEMSAIVESLKMDVSKAQIRRMMIESDPDLSGSIDFEEFVAATKQQIAAGNGGGLAGLVAEAGSFFGVFSDMFGTPLKALSEAVASTPFSELFGEDEDAKRRDERRKAKEAAVASEAAKRAAEAAAAIEAEAAAAEQDAARAERAKAVAAKSTRLLKASPSRLPAAFANEKEIRTFFVAPKVVRSPAFGSSSTARPWGGGGFGGASGRAAIWLSNNAALAISRSTAAVGLGGSVGGGPGSLTGSRISR